MTTTTISTAASYDVLSTRVDAIKSDFNSFQQQIEGRFNGLAGDIRLLVEKFDRRSTTQWPTLIMAGGLVATLVAGIGGAFILPMKDNIARLEQIGAAGTAELKSAMSKFADNTVSEREFASYMGNAKDRRDDQQRNAEARFARVEKDVDSIQDKVVPRGEHEQKWAAQAQRDVEIQRQIDQVRDKVEGIYSPKDELQSLHRQVEQLTSAVSSAQSNKR